MASSNSSNIIKMNNIENNNMFLNTHTLNKYNDLIEYKKKMN